MTIRRDSFGIPHVLFGAIGHDVWRRRVRSILPSPASLLLGHDSDAGGSNAFVIGGSLTRSGFPIIAGDPHRLFEAPNVYAQVRLSCPEFDVVGLAFPGVPGVQHFGHAGDVAWAVTGLARSTTWTSCWRSGSSRSTTC